MTCRLVSADTPAAADSADTLISYSPTTASHRRSFASRKSVICMVRHDICRHNYAVERRLVVGFCGQLHYIVSTDPTIRQPGFNLPHHTWSLTNRFRTGQGPCRANLHKWGLTQSPCCDCGQRRTVNHIVDTCPLTKFEGGPNLLHEADDNAVMWLESTATSTRAKYINLHDLFPNLCFVLLALPTYCAERGLCNGPVSVCLSVCPICRPLQQRTAGLLLSARRAGDVDRLLPLLPGWAPGSSGAAAVRGRNSKCGQCHADS